MAPIGYKTGGCYAIIEGMSVFNRQQDDFLAQWWSSSPRKPLIIRGARQVGKSTLVQTFAQKQGLSLAEVNLEKHPELKSAFSSKNIDTILQALEAVPGVLPVTERSLIFLDEIQALPEAFAALRYFYEKRPDVAVVAAGSLLECMLAQHHMPVPVGRVQYLYMGGLNFSEFLWALGEQTLSAQIKNHKLGDNINEFVHHRLLELLKVYFFVGGMPEAVQTYVQTKSFKKVFQVLAAIVQTYRDDFPKYTNSKDMSRIYNTFSTAARSAGQQVKLSSFSSEHKLSTIRQDVDLLCLSRILIKVVHSHCNGLPLHADLKTKTFKLFLLDIGLMNTLCGLPWDSVLLKNIQLVHRGALAEQFVAQHLQSLLFSNVDQQLTFWLQGGVRGAAEIDFVVQRQGRIVPVEVKSGASGSLKSLHQFMAIKKLSTAIRLDSNLPSTQWVQTKAFIHKVSQPVEYTLYNLPLYLAEKIL